MCDFKKFNEELPGKNKLYSSLRGKGISDKENLHALKVWKNILNEKYERLSRFLLKDGALRLVNVFEKFRNKCIENYGFCPSHYLSAPILSWDIVLNMAKVELELISNFDMNLLFEKGMRGGVSYILKDTVKQRISI